MGCSPVTRPPAGVHTPDCAFTAVLESNTETGEWRPEQGRPEDGPEREHGPRQRRHEAQGHNAALGSSHQRGTSRTS